MTTDAPVPLCSYAQFTAGAFGDLVSEWTQDAVTQVLCEATRQCEDMTGKRLAPFTMTETLRAEGIDPDEYGGAANIPMSLQGTLGMSYAMQLSGTDLVRHVWLGQKAKKYPDLWAYSNFSIKIISSYGGIQNVPITAILDGPENDTGHVWFQLGTFVPVGSRIQVTYSGGYTVATPASLVRGCKFMGAYNIVRELQPGTFQHDPQQLLADAKASLTPWTQ